jgi:hypothetical protein
MLALRLLSEGGEGSNTELLWIYYLGIGLFFLAVLVGWMTAGRKPDQPEVRNEAVKSTEKKRAVAKPKASRKK